MITTQSQRERATGDPFYIMLYDETQFLKMKFHGLPLRTHYNRSEKIFLHFKVTDHFQFEIIRPEPLLEFFLLVYLSPSTELLTANSGSTTKIWVDLTDLFIRPII